MDSNVLINTVEGYQKIRNVQRDPHVMINVADPGNRERVVEITREGAAEQFQKLIKRYLGKEEYRYG